MSKRRASVSTSFWSDPYVEELEPEEKLLFLYLITNPYTNMLGIYEVSIRRISYETAIPLERVRKAFEGLEKDKKAAYHPAGYVIVSNYLHHQAMNTNMQVSAINSFNELPEEVLSHPFIKDIFKALKGFGKPSEGLVKDWVSLPKGRRGKNEEEGKDYSSSSTGEEQEEMEGGKPDEKKDSEEGLTEVAESVKIGRRVASYLLQAICEYDPEHRYNKNKPKIKNWEKQLELAVRRDGRTEKQLQFVVDYLFRKQTEVGEFWRPNIQSGKSLRYKFDTLKDRIKADMKKRNQSKRSKHGRTNNKATVSHAEDLFDRVAEAWGEEGHGATGTG